MNIEKLEVAVYTIPTDAPESDGTLEWRETTLVLVHAFSSGVAGMGYTYADTGTAWIIREHLAPVVMGLNPMNIPEAWVKMVACQRNLGFTGAGAMAVSAVDSALWDLKAKLLSLPLVKLLGACRASLPVYGSGGFTSYDDAQLRNQLAGWAEGGITRFKIKVGREPSRDPHRVEVARATIGGEAELFVDANSAYSRKQALCNMERFARDYNVSWMEQPLLPEDREGMRWLRERAPAGMEIADGEYGCRLADFREMIGAGAVDVVMADATRCGGISGFLKVGALCEACQLPLSSHCAPLMHLHPGCALPAVRHAEYFHDHARIERMLFPGFPEPRDGALEPNLSEPGLGVAFNPEAAEPYFRPF